MGQRSTPSPVSLDYWCVHVFAVYRLWDMNPGTSHVGLASWSVVLCFAPAAAGVEDSCFDHSNVICSK